MKIKYREFGFYKTFSYRLKTSKERYRIRRSSIPRFYLQRTPELIYIIEFLKCDGSISIWKIGNGFGGEIIFSSTNNSYKERLISLVQKQFPNITTFKRPDGFGISSLVLSALLSQRFSVPIGEKEEMKCIIPKNFEEAKMILRSVIDSEGNVDAYSGNIVIGNISKEYLESYRHILSKWFKIKTSYLSPTKSWGRETLRISISKADNLRNIFEIGLFNPSKQENLKFIIESLNKYYIEKNYLKKKIKQILINPKTINDVSFEINLAPYITRRILRHMKIKKVGKININNRFNDLWGL